MSPWETRNVLACQWGLVDRTRHTSPRVTNTSATCLVVSWAFRMMPKAALLIDSPYKRANNTSAATKRRATFARHRFFWLSSPRCMQSTTDLVACAQSPSAFIA